MVREGEQLHHSPDPLIVYPASDSLVAVGRTRILSFISFGQGASSLYSIAERLQSLSNVKEILRCSSVTKEDMAPFGESCAYSISLQNTLLLKRPMAILQPAELSMLAKVADNSTFSCQPAGTESDIRCDRSTEIRIAATWCQDYTLICAINAMN